MQNNIYICHTPEDKEKVFSIVEAIRSLGYSVCSLSADEQLFKSIEDSFLFVYISSYSSNSSKDCAKAVGLAVDLKKPIFVIRIDSSPYNESILINMITANFIESGLPEDEFNFQLKYGLANYFGENISKNIPQEQSKNKNINPNFPSVRHSSKNSDAKSSYELGLYYESRDRKKAIEHLEESSKRGYNLATLELYKLSAKGYEREGLDGFELDLVSGNDSEAIFQLAEWYYHDDTFPFVYEKIYRLYERASERGCTEAGQRLITFERLSSLLRAYERGDSAAAFRIGLEFEFGQKINQDTGEAIFWFKRASKSGMKHASHHLACMYEYGSGVTTSFDNAKRYYELAASQGHEYSKSHLQKLTVSNNSDVVILKDGVYYDPKHSDYIDLSKYPDTKIYCIIFGVLSIYFSFSFIINRSLYNNLALIFPLTLITFVIYSILSVLKRKPYSLFYLRVCMILQLTSLWSIFFVIGAIIWSFSSDEIKELFPKSYRKTSIIDYVVVILILVLMFISLIYGVKS